MSGVTTHSFASAGTASITLPPGDTGNALLLLVTVNSTTAPTAPTGWALESAFRFVAPIWRTYSRTRGSGDTDVSLTVAAAATVVVIDFGAAPPVDPLAGSTPGDPGPTTLYVVNDSPVSGLPPVTDAVVVAWHEDAGYVDTAGDFSHLATVTAGAMTQSVYVASGMVDLTTYSITLEEPSGIIHRTDLWPFFPAVTATPMLRVGLRMRPT